MEQKIILVDEADKQTGVAEKTEVHKKGLLHRAFSIFIFNYKGEMLLQRRALNKYHSGGLWTNACCSHPSPGEDTHEAALRRLNEEIGFETEIKEIFDFVYKAKFSNGLTEYEFDHVFAGEYEGVITINEKEVMDSCYVSMAELKNSLRNDPGKYTKWFQLAFPKIETWWRERYKHIVTE